MEVTDTIFATRVQRKLAEKAAHAARALRARIKAAKAAAKLPPPGVPVTLKATGETVEVSPNFAKAITKIRQIAQGGSSSFAPHLASPKPTDDEVSEERPIVVDPIEEIKDAQQKAISAELAKQRYRLSWRVAKRLNVNEKLIQTVLQTVTSLVPQIDKEKRLMERWIREIYAGKIEKVRRDRTGDNVRHDSRVRHKRGNIDRRGMVVEL